MLHQGKKAYAVLFWWLYQRVDCLEEKCYLNSSSSLNVSAWHVVSRPDHEVALAEKMFKKIKFEVVSKDTRFNLIFATVEGVPWPQPIDSDLYAWARRKLRFRKGDVVVASYPKSGTTWTEQIVLLLLHGSSAASKLRPKQRNSYSPRTGIGKVWLEPMLARKRTGGRRSAAFSEERALTRFEEIPSPRLIKSHAPFDMLLGVCDSRESPLRTGQALNRIGSKVVYVARNFKDAAVSLFYQRAPVNTERRMPMDAWLALYLRGKMSCGAYVDHVTLWYAASQAFPENIFFLRYEDLHFEALATISRLAHFLQLDRSKSELFRVLNASTLDAMKGTAGDARQESNRRRSLLQYSQTRSRNKKVTVTPKKSPRSKSGPHAKRYAIPPGGSTRDISGIQQSSHLRQGSVGSWRTHFESFFNKQVDAIYNSSINQAMQRATMAMGLNPELEPPSFDFGCGLHFRRRQRRL